jgi:acyl carrier protein
MEPKTIEERILDVLKEQTGKETISLTDTFREDLKFDSLDVVETAVLIEDQFGVETNDEEIGQFNTVGELVKHMEGRVDG